MHSEPLRDRNYRKVAFPKLSYNKVTVKPCINRKPFAKLLLVIALWTCRCHGQEACSQKRSFSDEDRMCFDKGITISPSVIASIFKTDKARDSFPEIEAGDLSPVSKLLKGITVHLRDERQSDVIVRGDFPMSGGDNTWFWIVTAIDSRPSALWVRCNTVTILRVRHHGYADIRTDWAAGSHRDTQIFRSDGHRYKLYRDKYVDLLPN